MWLFMTFQLRGTEEYFTRWYYTLYYVVEILELSVYDHLNENHWAVLSCHTNCYALQGGYYFSLWKSIVTLISI